MSLRALAGVVGVSVPFLSDVEHDRRSLSDETATRVAEALGLHLDDLDLRRGWSRDLGEWISRDPDLVRLLREARRSGRRLLLCPSLAPSESLEAWPAVPDSHKAV